MKPAFSVLFFTVTSGIGYGLLMCLVFINLLSGHAGDVTHFLITGFVGLTLATLGLLSSTLHLANPKNAWRAFSRFKTSWLSREGVFSLVYYPVFLVYALLVYINDGQLSFLALVFGVLSLLVALSIVICTGMIYASLKPIRQWHNPLVTPIYVLFSFMSGVLAFSLAMLTLEDLMLSLVNKAFIALAVIAFVVKMLYFVLIGKPDGSTINTATGFSQAQVRLLDAGHNADTFLTKEFVFDAGAKKLLRLRWLMVALTFALPIALIIVASLLSASILTFFAMLSVYAGLFVERWLFFAEARHVVRLYHGDQRT